MNKRTNTILLVLLVIQATLVLNAFWGGSNGDPSMGQLLKGLDTAAITSLAIASNDGKNLELRKGAEDSWQIPELGGYPADRKKVEGFLEKLGKLDTRMVVASTRAAHGRLQVARNKFNRTVSIGNTATNQPVVLYLGSSPSQGQLHVRLDGDDRVYLTRAISAWEASPESSSWIDREYVRVPVVDILALDLENANGHLGFEKVDDGKWTASDLAQNEVANSEAVDVLANRLSTVRMQDVLGTDEEPTYGLNAPELRATLTYRGDTGGETPETLTIVASLKDDSRSSHVVKSSQSAFYVTVPAYALREAIEAKREAYVTGTAPAPNPR